MSERFNLEKCQFAHWQLYRHIQVCCLKSPGVVCTVSFITDCKYISIITLGRLGYDSVLNKYNIACIYSLDVAVNPFHLFTVWLPGLTVHLLQKNINDANIFTPRAENLYKVTYIHQTHCGPPDAVGACLRSVVATRS